MVVQNASSLTVRIFQTVCARATQFTLLNRQDFNISLLLFILEHVLQEACCIRSKLLNISIERNTNVPQNGGRMYPSRDVTFITAIMNSFALYVKGAIAQCVAVSRVPGQLASKPRSLVGGGGVTPIGAVYRVATGVKIFDCRKMALTA